ncbi:4-hydroxy-2-oxo-heptane-1,7-dioate aldolase [Verrucomicrobiota bacterium]|nr:4-hydroxy-2-oxo-heptane-1,7-dioate aldolase [Verrucomicrobiota bacterium]
MKNHLKELIATGRVALGAQLRMGVPAIAELFAAAGFDYLVLDGEHATQTPIGIQAQLQAVNGYNCTPLVRFGRNDPDEIRLALDMGAGGVVIPLLKTAAEVEKLVQACHYPPRGTRSYGPSRAYRYGFDREYYPRSQPSLVTMIIIETGEAVDNIDEILAVDGLDTIFLGLADLSVTLGAPLDYGHPRVEAAVERVLAAAHDAGKPAGVSFYPDNMPMMRRRVEQGARVFMVGGDEWMLYESCKKMIESAASLRK